MNGEGFCRTATATPGLLKNTYHLPLEKDCTYPKGEGGNRHTYRPTDIVTYRLNRPRGYFSEKAYMGQETDMARPPAGSLCRQNKAKNVNCTRPL